MQCTCPQCGAPLELRAADRRLICDSCGTPLVAEAEQALFHEVMEATITSEDEAKARLRRHFASAEMPPGFYRKATVTSARLELFPFWVFGDDSGEGRDAMIPAAPTPVPGLHGWRLPAGKRSPMSPGAIGETPVHEVTVPLSTARTWLSASRPRSVQRYLLVHLPLFSMSYRYRGKEWSALVDAVTGRVFLSIRPRPTETPFVMVLVLMVLVFAAEGLLIADDLLRLEVYLVSIPAVAAVTWIFCRRL